MGQLRILLKIGVLEIKVYKRYGVLILYSKKH